MTAVALLLAGCAQQAPSPDDEAPPASGAFPRGEGCSGFQLIAPWAGPHPRAHVPPGWDASKPASSIHVEAWACQRVSWGPFERGPVRILLETHDQQATPAGCRAADEVTQLAMLQSLWTDDAELGAYLASLGLPARAAPMASADASVAGAPLREWTWGEAGEASRVAVPVPSPAIPAAPVLTRLFWDNGTAVSAMDLRASVSPPGLRAAAADVIPQAVPVADFAQPMLLAESPAAPAFAHGFQDGHWSADLRHYEDLQCHARSASS